MATKISNATGSAAKKANVSTGIATSAAVGKINPVIEKLTLNIPANQLKTWKTRVDRVIIEELVAALKGIENDALTLKGITATDADDKDNLSYRFNDLASLTKQSADKITEFMKSFDTNLDKFIKAMESADKTINEKAKKSIDQFAESASQISKLKM